MNTRGYTLLEVSLFLAISGGLTLVAIVGLAPRLNNVRFSTAVRGVQDSLSKELSASELGKNSSAGRLKCTPGQSMTVEEEAVGVSGSCLLLGRLAVFEASPKNQVVYWNIIGLRTPVNSLTTCTTKSDSLEFIRDCHQALALNSSTSTYNYSNGLTQSSETRAFGFVRSPSTNTIYRFSITKPGSDYSSNIPLADQDLVYNRINGTPSREFPVCLSLSGRSAELILSTVRSSTELNFNVECI